MTKMQDENSNRTRYSTREQIGRTEILLLSLCLSPPPLSSLSLSSLSPPSLLSLSEDRKRDGERHRERERGVGAEAERDRVRERTMACVWQLGARMRSCVSFVCVCVCV